MNRTRQILKKSAAVALGASLKAYGEAVQHLQQVPIRKQKRLPLTNSQTVFRKPGILISKITRNLPPEVKAT